MNIIMNKRLTRCQLFSSAAKKLQNVPKDGRASVNFIFRLSNKPDFTIVVIAFDAILLRAQALRPYGFCDLLTVFHKECILLY
jgi:hypothetical protein